MQLIKPKQQQECLLGNQTILSNSIPAHAERFFLFFYFSLSQRWNGNHRKWAEAGQSRTDNNGSGQHQSRGGAEGREAADVAVLQGVAAGVEKVQINGILGLEPFTKV